LKKVAKFTGDVPLRVCLVKPRLKPANPQADPCPSLDIFEEIKKLALELLHKDATY
jgi:hypothetical protein